MRLVSQDGIIDVPYENVIIACEKNRDDKFSIYARCSHCLGLATYSTEAKALKVMEMVRNKYAGLQYLKFFYQNGLLTEMHKELGFDEMKNALTSIFKFPADEEVEV